MGFKIVGFAAEMRSWKIGRKAKCCIMNYLSPYKILFKFDTIDTRTKGISYDLLFNPL